MKLTEAQTTILCRGIVMESLGGFCALSASEYRCCERLRSRRYLKYHGSRQTKSWKNQFFHITRAGQEAYRAVLNQEGRGDES